MNNTLLLTAADGARARIHLQGAHVSVWTPAGESSSRLFLSERAVFAEGVAIRGGVPVIFPQFAGKGPFVKHGFARILPWKFLGQSSLADGRTQAVFTLSDSSATRAYWPHVFGAQLAITLGGTALEVQLRIHNNGASAFDFTAALHTYLAVADIDDVQLQGLQSCVYDDTAAGGVRQQESADALRIAGEVDRNYFDTPAELILRESARSLRIAQQGFCDTVVWNPGAVASRGFNDLAPDDYRHFFCIEAASIQRPITLAPGAEWQGSQTLRTTG